MRSLHFGAAAILPKSLQQFCVIQKKSLQMRNGEASQAYASL